MSSPILSGFRNLANGIGSLWSGRSMYPAISPETDRERPAHVDMAADFADLLPQARFRKAVSDCRWFSIASDVIAGASIQKADYVSASHWATHYTGSDRAWGEQAEEAIQQLNALCCTRGERFPWKKMWWLTIPHAISDGGVFLNLTETETGWPLVQPIEVTRVASRDDSPEVKPKSARAWKRSDTGKFTRIYTPYAGLRITSGIIYDDAGREVAFRVLGDAVDGSDDVDVSAQDMIHLADARWFSEGRPMPEMAPSALALQDIALARQAQLSKHLHSARLIALRKTESGTPAQKRLGGDQLATRTPSGKDVSTVDEGQLTYIKHKDEMLPWDTKTPGGEWMAFDDKTVASALHAIGWRIEMADPKQSGSGANTRAFADQINTAITAAFDARVTAVKRVRSWQIAKLIQRGDLPPNSEWWKWGVTPPAEFSPDPGRAISSELEAVRAGAQSMPHLHRRWGQRPREVLEEQANYEADRIEVAAEVSAARGITIDPSKLGTLTMPGDVPAGAAPNENEQNLASIEQTKARADAFGVSVRAGAVTPSEEDEQFMREQLGLPTMSAAVKSAWQKEGVRRPITIADATGARPAPPPQPTEP